MSRYRQSHRRRHHRDYERGDENSSNAHTGPKVDSDEGPGRYDSRRRRRNGPCRGPIGRVVRGLSDRLGVHRHTIIAGFVLGFIFVPILTLLVFLGAVYWVNDPERIEDKLDHLADKARNSYRTHFGSGSGQRRNRYGAPENQPRAARTAPEDNADPRSNPDSHADFVPDFPELRRKFEELETRAAAMETCVASEEFALNRQFRAMGR